MTDEAPAGPARSVGRVAALFDSVADTYDTVGPPWFTPIAEGLVAEAAPAAGERALDIGTGRGAVLWPLAVAVGPAGHVTAVDLSSRMVAATAGDAARRGLGHVRLVVGDAQALDVEGGPFDLAVSSLVLFFLPDPAAALRTWHAALRPGGRLAVATFGPRHEVWRHVDDTFTPYLPPAVLDARTSGTQGPFASDEGMAALVEEAGFTGVRTAHLSLAARFADIGAWRDWSMSHAQRGWWQAVPEDRRADVLDEIERRLEPAREAGGGYALTQDVRYTLAHRPD